MSKRQADVRRDPPSKPPIIPAWLIPVVVLIVVLMWAASTVYSMRNPNWPVPASAHAAVIAIITGLMGYLTMRGRMNGNG